MADFRDGYHERSWDPLWASFGDDWRALWFDERIEPPSWVLGDLVIAERARGILFRSSLTEEGCNLVLYPDELGESDEIVVHDPEGDLPRDQDS